VPDRDSIRTRFVPAVLTGLGGIFLMAGLLSYTNPVTASAPSPGATSFPESSPSMPLLTFPPVSPAPTETASPSASAATRVATRIVIPALGIDLPIVKPPSGDAYPYCNVAMYFQGSPWVQPGHPGPTYIYAHARTGMFLPLLDGSKVNNGARMKGMLVQVYTSDDQLFLYSISEVDRHVLTLDKALSSTGEILWLQTSEGPHGTPQKLQVAALPLSSGPANHSDAHPTPHPVVCG
jgi:hypothetical protein